MQGNYTASQIEPGWSVYTTDQGQIVTMVIESEAPDGTRFITIWFQGGSQPLRLPKDTVVSASPPPDVSDTTGS